MSLNNMELENLFRQGEISNRVEFKAEFKGKADEVRKAICAFSNDMPGNKQPGVIFIGVKNDGTCYDLDINEELLTQLAQLRSDGQILPLPAIDVKRITIDDCQMAAIIVEPTKSPPVRYKDNVWIRVGPLPKVASEDEIRILTERRRSAQLPYDTKPFYGTSLEDLDLDLFRTNYLPLAFDEKVLDKNDRSIEKQLDTLRFFDGRANCCTAAGILVFGKDPRRWLPGTYIQFARFDGLEITDPVKDQKVIEGNLFQIMKEIEELIKINIQVQTTIGETVRELRTPDYPKVALLEIVKNAIMHRNYETTNAPIKFYWFEDRVEISSPGGPYGRVNVDNFGTGLTDYRNPQIAEVMKVLGYVQKFGLGIPEAKKQMEKNGNPPLEWEVYDSQVLVILRSRSNK